MLCAFGFNVDIHLHHSLCQVHGLLSMTLSVRRGWDALCVDEKCNALVLTESACSLGGTLCLCLGTLHLTQGYRVLSEIRGAWALCMYLDNMLFYRDQLPRFDGKHALACVDSGVLDDRVVMNGNRLVLHEMYK